VICIDLYKVIELYLDIVFYFAQLREGYLLLTLRFESSGCDKTVVESIISVN